MTNETNRLYTSFSYFHMEELSLYGKTKSYGNIMLYLGTLYSYIDLLHTIAINFPSANW